MTINTSTSSKDIGAASILPDTLSFDQGMLICCGHTAFQIVWSAQRLNVFEELSSNQSLTAAELQSRIKLQDRPFRILLTALLSLKIVLRGPTGKLCLAEIAERMLVRNNPDNWIDALEWQGHIVYPGEADLITSLRENRNDGLRHFPGPGSTLYERLSVNPPLERVFHSAMSALSSSSSKALAEARPFLGCRHLVDFGGGDGTNAIAAAKLHPELEVTIFDHPSVCNVALKRIASSGYHGTIRTHPGNIFIDSPPDTMDSALLAHLLTIWSPEKNVVLLRRINDALPKGGRLAVYGMMGDNDLTGPMSAALGSPYFLSIATGEGMIYTVAEVSQMISNSGFAIDGVSSLGRDHHLISATKV